MQWMRLRPDSPEELDEVDWRGRWIDDEEDQYDDGIDGEAEEDRRMEDFDPVRHVFSSMPPWNNSHPAQDHADDDDDDDDEEEEEEEESKAAAARGSRRHATGSQNEPTDRPLVRSMATGSTFSAFQEDSRGPVVGQLIAVWQGDFVKYHTMSYFSSDTIIIPWNWIFKIVRKSGGSTVQFKATHIPAWRLQINR
jgi:hypothetical protein